MDGLKVITFRLSLGIKNFSKWPFQFPCHWANAAFFFILIWTANTTNSWLDYDANKPVGPFATRFSLGLWGKATLDPFFHDQVWLEAWKKDSNKWLSLYKKTWFSLELRFIVKMLELNMIFFSLLIFHAYWIPHKLWALQA